MPHVTHESHEIAIEIAIDRLARRRPTQLQQPATRQQTRGLTRPPGGWMDDAPAEIMGSPPTGRQAAGAGENSAHDATHLQVDAARHLGTHTREAIGVGMGRR